MIYAVYKCDDFELEHNILTIYDADIIAKVDSEESFNKVIKTFTYNAVVCPDLYKEGKQIDTILFK